VDIAVQSQGEWLLVRIRDDGVGLPPARLRALGSHGLAAMRHRALVLGGQWQVGPRPGGGTQIEVRLPLAQILAAAPPAGASAAVQ